MSGDNTGTAWVGPGSALAAALDVALPSGGARSAITCTDLRRNDVEDEFIVNYPAGSAVAVEVYRWFDCTAPATSPGWVFDATNGTVSGMFVRGGRDGDVLFHYVNGPEG